MPPAPSSDLRFCPRAGLNGRVAKEVLPPPIPARTLSIPRFRFTLSRGAARGYTSPAVELSYLIFRLEVYMKQIRIVAYTALLLAMFILGWQFGKSDVTTVHAQSRATIPRAWGTFKGATQGAFYFEASDGTLRVVQINNGQVMYEASRK